MPLFEGLWSENTTYWGADQDAWSSAFSSEIMEAIAQRGVAVRMKNKRWQQLMDDERAKMFFKDAQISNNPELQEITYDLDKILELLGWTKEDVISKIKLRERIEERFKSWLLLEAKRNKTRYKKRNPHKFTKKKIVEKSKPADYSIIKESYTNFLSDDYTQNKIIKEQRDITFKDKFLTLLEQYKPSLKMVEDVLNERYSVKKRITTKKKKVKDKLNVYEVMNSKWSKK